MRKFIILLLLALMLLTLAGCLGRKPPETITLTWWITFAEDSAEYPVFAAIAQAFAQKTGYQVEIVSVPWSDIAPRSYGSTRLMLAQEEGTGPDVWGPAPHNWTGGFVAEKQVLALERERIQDILQYDDAALWACQAGQQQYGLPILADSVALIYNKQLVSEPPKSFDELLQLARAQTDAKQGRWGLVLPLLSQYHVYPFIEGYGGYVFQCSRDECDHTDIGLNNEGAVRGVQLLADLYVKDKIFPEPLVDREAMDEHALYLFAGGRAAMLIDGSWVLSTLRDRGVDYGIASIPPLPGATRSPRPWIIVQALYISAGSTHPDQAIELINYLAGPESVEPMQKALGKTPVRRDILRSAAFRADKDVQAWHEQIAAGVPLPGPPEMDLIWSPWGQALDEAIPGLAPVQDALDRAVAEFKSYFEEE